MSSESDNKPMVSVVMIAYNNGRHIATAIEGVVRQKTDFRVELLVSDDASSDNTREIVADYARQYPDTIRLLCHESNVGIQRNYLSVFPHCRGKYLAMCDADDYWCSRHKLARQVDYMESHPECSVTFHRVVNLYEPSGVKSLSGKPSSHDLTISDLAKGNIITNMSVMYRRGCVDMTSLPGWLSEIRLLDYGMHMLFARHGTIHYINRSMGVYRQWSNGAWSLTRNFERLKMALNVRKHLLDEFRDDKEVCENLKQASVNILAAMYEASGSEDEMLEIDRMLESIDSGLTRTRVMSTRQSPPQKSMAKKALRQCRIFISRMIPAPKP